MQCPKCKKNVDENSIKCPHCNTKIGVLCKDCGAYNLITNTECNICGKILLRICDNCGAANLPEAKICRKCSTAFFKTSDVTVGDLPQYNSIADTQQKAKAKLLEGIKSAEKRIITISGESGVGKSLIIRHVIDDLKNVKLVWLSGSCNQITQLSPFGYFQNLMLNFFNINNFCADTLQLKKDSLRFFKEDFPTLNNQEVVDLLNFLYPETLDKYENIYFNKVKMFSILKKVLLTVVEKAKVIFILDNIEFIDGMSFDFLKELFKDDLIKERSKLILTSKEPKPGIGFLSVSGYDSENYLDITLSTFTDLQVDLFLKQYKDMKFNKDFAIQALKISNGNPAILEQIVLLDNEIKIKGLKNITYNSFEKIISLRLSLLKQENIKAYRLLVAMSVLGEKFYPAILENFDNNSLQEYEQCIEKLVNNGFITQLTNLSFEFKCTRFWKTVVTLVKNENEFEEILNQLQELFCSYKQSSVALLGYVVQKLNNNDQAFDVWTLLMKQSAYIGDISLYIISQKQALKLIENKTGDFYRKVKKNIYIRVGKLLEPIDSLASFEYLQKAIMMLEDNEDALHIEMLGYLSSCAMKLGNYWGAIECVENVLNKLPEEMFFNKILLKSRLVKPLLKLGNYGQLVNLVETEILLELEKVLAKGKNTSQILINDLYELWLDVYFDYAEALVFQGDNRCFEVIQSIYDILDKNKTSDASLICRINLLLALANTIKGDIKTSIKILDDILKEFTLDNMDEFIVSRWNFIDVLNKFFLKDYNNLQAELFNVVSFANNINDNFTKNILKTLLAIMLKDSNQTKKALEILEEQVAYFAKEKVASGVLLSWYLIAGIKLITNGTQFALDVATKALDIAQSPNINNYYFITLFNKLIGEIYLAKQDYDSAKVYFEKSLFISKKFDLQYIQVDTYIVSAKLYQELALPKSNLRNDYIKHSLKMFQQAKNVEIVENNLVLQKRIKEELNILTSFCKLNGIILKKDNK